MSELKATPGPWFIGDEGDPAEVVCNFDCSPFYKIMSDMGVREPIDDANLIAAAPDMYAELGNAEEMISEFLVYVTDPVMRHTLKQHLEGIQKVKAKARGD